METPTTSKITFTAAELSSELSPSEPLSTKKLNMSLDVDSFLSLLNDARVKTVFQFMFVDAISRELKIRDDKIATLQSEISDLKTVISDMKSEKALKREKVEIELDEQEQYSRRNNLRVFLKVPESREEDATNLIIDHGKTIGVALTPNDISRSHCLGNMVRGKIWPVIVKFTSYWKRKEFFDNRKKDGILIAEDLTDRRSKILYHDRQLRRDKKILYCWTPDGNIYVKPIPDINDQNKEQKSVKIKSLHDLEAFGVVLNWILKINLSKLWLVPSLNLMHDKIVQIHTHNFVFLVLYRITLSDL